MVTPEQLVDRALALAEEGGRADLHRRLTLARRRSASPGVRVLVVGEPGQGKSSLVNALVGVPVCPVSDDVVSAVPTVVRAGDAPRAALVRTVAPGPAGGGDEEATERVPVPVETVAARVAGPGAEGVVRAEVELPRKLLERGLELVDTAGVGGLGVAHSLATVDLLPTADAVLLVSDASQEFTAPEMAVLEHAAALCPTVVCVLTKTDACPDWRQVADLDRAHLDRRGHDVPLFAVSSTLALLAVQHRDRELHEESGIGALVAHLREQVAGRAAALARRSLVHDLTAVTGHLALATRSELRTLEDPASREALLDELEQARAAVDDQRRRSSRWQQVLADGVTDLVADIDHDLRDRSRVVLREAEEVIAARDPGPAWPEVTAWLDQRVAAAVADSYVWAEQRSQWLAERVVEQFARDGGVAVPDLRVGAAADALAALVEVPGIDDGDLTLRERVLVGLRGSYTGVLMTGLVTSLAGLAIINPFSLAAGVLLGRKAYNDDARQRRQRRESEARTVVRRHLDEVVFQVGKHLKDRLRVVQRTLRDLITDATDEAARSLADAVRAAQRSTKEATAEQDARTRVLRARFDRIERLAADVRRLEPAPAAVPSSVPAPVAAP
ncbi:Dynamin family protein [Geodermatophilus telluris]|uniref:Dynamin family protein n=1 Tax=Geodermatophilus telluris TaxID=1190417 RepID=A0A1G6UB49_9ACTN|nr:dynamin family protein [Geodermatophilus telluris]SDD38491.1 Dynamin family protein [Geodermatophilus telluris]